MLNRNYQMLLMLTLFAGVALFAATARATAGEPNKTDQWVEQSSTDGVRFVWAYGFPPGDEAISPRKVPNIEQHFKMLKSKGINMVGVGYELLRNVDASQTQEDGAYYEKTEQKRIDHLRRIVRTAGENDMAIMILLQTYKEPYVEVIEGKTYRKAKDMYGSTAEVLACPSDLSFWRGIELPRMKLVAELLRDEQAVGGVLFETEAYLARKFYPGYGSQKTQFCFCDACFAGAMQEVDSTDPLPQKQDRYEWLCNNNLDGWYQQEYMVGVYAKTYRTLYEEIREIYPDTLAALYQLGVDPNSDGFAKGTATDRLPAMMFSSAEYFYGYDRTEIRGFSNVARSRDFQSELDAMNINVRFLCGLITGPYWPEQYAAELALIQKYTDGYWIYDGSVMLQPAKKVVTKNPVNRNQYYLKGQPSAFWDAIGQINQAYDQRATKKHATTEPTSDRTQAFDTELRVVDKADDTVSLASLPAEATQWESNGVSVIKSSNMWEFPADQAIQGKRSTQLMAAFPNNLEIGATYGFAATVTNHSDSQGRWINLGYSRKPPFPIFYDRNILIHPGETATHRYTFTPTEKWGENYWVRVGVRNGDASLMVNPGPLQRLYTTEFITDNITLPQADEVMLELKNSPAGIFQYRYDVLAGPDLKVVMADCHSETDISVVRSLDIENIVVRIKILAEQSDVAVTPSDFQWRLR